MCLAFRGPALICDGMSDAASYKFVTVVSRFIDIGTFTFEIASAKQACFCANTSITRSCTGATRKKKAATVHVFRPACSNGRGRVERGKSCSLTHEPVMSVGWFPVDVGNFRAVTRIKQLSTLSAEI